MPDRSALQSLGATMNVGDGRYPWIGIMREVPGNAHLIGAGIGNIRKVIENTQNSENAPDEADFGVGAMLRSSNGGANWEFVPLEGADADEVVHDLDYFRVINDNDICAFVTTNKALYFSSNLFSAGTGVDVEFKRTILEDAGGILFSDLRGTVSLGDATPVANTETIDLYVSVCSLNQSLGGVYTIQTDLTELGVGLNRAWVKMTVNNPQADAKNFGRLVEKPGSTRNNFEMFVGKYNTPFLAVANNVEKKWYKIAGKANNSDPGYREDNTHLRFGSFDFNPDDPNDHPGVYACWNYGPHLAKGNSSNYKAMRTYDQIFATKTSAPDEGSINFYQSRGLDEVWFTGQQVVFDPSDANIIMVGCGDNQLLRSIDRGNSWSARRLRKKTEWKPDYNSVQQFVYHLAFHPDNPNLIIASAGPTNKANEGNAGGDGELLYNAAGGAGDSTTWHTLAGGKDNEVETNFKGLPNGEVHAFTFDRRNPRKGLFVAVRNRGIYYGHVETDHTVSSDFQQIFDTNLTDKIPSAPGDWHNYSRLEFDPYDDNVLYLARRWPAGGVFKITLGFDSGTQSRPSVTSPDFIASVDEVITSRFDAAGDERDNPFSSNNTSDVINILITQTHVYAGITCGHDPDKASVDEFGNKNYVGGLVRWDKSFTAGNYEWVIGGPSGTPGKTISIGGLAQDPSYPNYIFASTYRFKLKVNRTQDGLYNGEENYKPLSIWRSTDGGGNFSPLGFGLSEHSFPEAVSMAVFPDNPDEMIMPTHGTGIWMAMRTPPYDPGMGKVALPDSTHNRGNLPKRFALQANYPNPFNPATMIKYDLPKADHVRLSIHDVLGHEIKTLVDRDLEAGYHSTVWDGKDNAGWPVASGIYFCRFRASAFTRVVKMTLMR